jgi:NAD(P)-dependent dehydrogenase (short-subunit alcohol dehydrogenase family)
METSNDPTAGGVTATGAASENPVALVTGAASGIGRAAAVRLAEDGHRISCFDLDAAGLEETVATIVEAGGEAFAIEGSVTDEVATKNAVAATVERFGSLDVLANVAGVGHYCHAADETLEAWNRTIEINLTGTFLMCRSALPELREHGGNIVNVASIAGLAGHAYGAAYSASKGGVVAFSKTLAAEYASQGIRVNLVCPGGVLTPLLSNFMPPDDADPDLVARAVPLTKTLLDPIEIANAIAFFASAMPNTTGAMLVIDGATIV